MIFAEIVYDFTSLTVELASYALAVAAAMGIVFVAALLVFGFRQCADFVWWCFDMVTCSKYDRDDYGSRMAYHEHQQWLRQEDRKG
jgi:hypothetical protein